MRMTSPPPPRVGHKMVAMVRRLPSNGPLNVQFKLEYFKNESIYKFPNTWDAVTSVNLTYLWSDIYHPILCVRQIVYMNKNGGF